MPEPKIPKEVIKPKPKPTPPEIYVIIRMYSFPAGSVSHLSGDRYFTSKEEAERVLKKHYNDRYHVEALQLHSEG